MIPFKSGVIQVTATTTASSLRTLITAANSGPVDFSKLPGGQVDHIEFFAEGSVTFTIDGSAPTATTVLQAAAVSGILVYEGVSLDQMWFYGSNVKIDIQLGTQGKM